jgi:hypothetical protein
MPHPVPRAEDDDLDALNGRLAAVDLERKDENSRPVNPFAPYLENGSFRSVNDLARTLIPELLGSFKRPVGSTSMKLAQST